MSHLFQEFLSISKAEWKDQIIKDLKGKDISELAFQDAVEGVDYSAFYHREDRVVDSITPGSFPSTRGSKTNNNEWNNGALIIVSEESAANKNALNLLMKGVDLLYFVANKPSTDWSKVLEGIQLEYIKTQFTVKNPNEVQAVLEIAGNARTNISFCFDLMEIEPDSNLHDLMRPRQNATYLVNGYGVQRCGANASEEIAFCLAAGHENLINLMNAGFSIDEAAAQIHFHVGVGSNYFFEIAKLRALRALWSKIIHAYGPASKCSLNCQLTAIIGHTNKSLKDPYTNLLRQTTETMAAASVADAVIVLPYDFYSTSGASELAQRMAINISSILKEESYLNHVIDATGGSYAIENLTDKIGMKAWKLFQKIEAQGGLSNKTALNILREEVQQTAAKRLEGYSSGKTTLIGVNKFPSPEPKDINWTEIPGYLDMPSFNVERSKTTTAV